MTLAFIFRGLDHIFKGLPRQPNPKPDTLTQIKHLKPHMKQQISSINLEKGSDWPASFLIKLMISTGPPGAMGRKMGHALCFPSVLGQGSYKAQK